MKNLGEKFEINGVNLEVVESPHSETCTGCYFEPDFACEGDKKLFACASDEREDGQSVIFKEVQQ